MGVFMTCVLYEVVFWSIKTNISAVLGIWRIWSNTSTGVKTGKQTRPKKKILVTVKNELMSLRICMGFLKAFKMNSFPTEADGSCAVFFHKIRVERLLKNLRCISSWCVMRFSAWEGLRGTWNNAGYLYFRHQWLPSDHCSYRWAAGLYLGGSSRCRSDLLHLWEPKPWCRVQCQRLRSQRWPGEHPHLQNHHAR